MNGQARLMWDVLASINPPFVQAAAAAQGAGASLSGRCPVLGFDGGARRGPMI